MTKEISAGMVVYNPKLKKYLLLEYETHWGFVKGGVEKNETREEAAKRELKEETGIREFKYLDFEAKISYFYRKNKETVYKEVVFFLITTKNEEIKISNEHKSYRWCDVKEANKLIKFKNTKDVFEEANKLIEILKI